MRVRDCATSTSQPSSEYFSNLVNTKQPTFKMPSEITDIKQFLEIARRKDATGELGSFLPNLVAEDDTKKAAAVEDGKRFLASCASYSEIGG